MNSYKNKIEILELIEGAKKAEGLTVIIDVFRAFSFEAYAYSFGASRLRPVGSLEEAYRWKKGNSEIILAGERDGKKCEGFDVGNSPSAAEKMDLAGKTIIHTTSAGTQGIINATAASQILTGSLVNAKATAEYIIRQNPERVSLVCMGKAGLKPTAEDNLCAEYIKSLLCGDPEFEIDKKTEALRYQGGEHFFDPDMQEVYPEEDFWMCTKHDIFDFVLKIERDEKGFYAKKI